jgi:glycosyltransferase involved in cell wall biosynthesis
MKICHVITRLILGGAQENTLLTCQGQHSRGQQVTLVTGPAIGPEGQLMDSARRGGYRVIVLDDLRREIGVAKDFLAYRSLVSLLRDIRPDVLHTHSSKAGILARRAGKTVGQMKIVHTIHGLPFHSYQRWWLNQLYIRLERSAAKHTDAIISVADAMTRQALAAGIGQTQQYTTIYSGMDVQPYLNRTPQADEFRNSLNLPAGAVLVTQVSRLAELKGHEFILAAARRICDEDKNVHFCFVGDGYLRREIESAIRSSGLASRFHLTGLVGPSKIPAIMHATDILVHCSLREGLARTLPQAMLAGRPVVSFDIDGAGEVVSDQTGVLLPPRDVKGLAGAILALAQSPQLRETLGRQGRQLCQHRFDHNFMVDEIMKVYEKLLAR